MMLIKIRAFDNLFFKDGKPFSMKDENWANGIFPPSPSVFYGAIRTAFASYNNISFDKLDNSENDPTNNLRINFIAYSIGSNEDNLYYPLPQDLVKRKIEGENTSSAFQLRLIENDGLNSNQLPYLLEPTDADIYEDISNAIFAEDQLKKYLSSKSEKYYFKNLDDLIKLEPKVGIGRSDTSKTSQEGLLYRVGMRRMQSIESNQEQHFNFIIGFDGINDFPEEGYLKLGAEGKTAKFSQAKVDKQTDVNLTSNKIKITLLTPAIFNNGWLPEEWDPFGFTFTYQGIDMKLLAAKIKYPKYLGGFDMKNKTPKEMKKTVPEGSVYYLEIENNPEKAIEIFQQNSISKHKSKEGFGIAVVGGVN